MSETSTDAVELGTTDSTSLPTLQTTNISVPTPASGNNPENGDPNSVEAPPFDLAEPFDMTLKARGRRGKIAVRHVLRRATLRELMERDAAQPYRTRMINDEIEEPIADLENKADINLYNKLVVLTSGYRNNVAEEQSAAERADALASIPAAHKQNVISQIVPVNAEYVPEAMPEGEDAEVFVWGEGLTYKFKVEFGVEGMFKAFVLMNEPSEAQLSQYRASTHFQIEKVGGARKPVTRMTVDLKPAVTVFDELVESIEGLVVAGEPFDAKNQNHLKLVDPYFKRAVITALVKQTQLDLGN